MKILTKTSLTILFTLGLSLLFTRTVLAAPHFVLEPATDSNTTFSINLTIDTDNTPTNSADVVIDFDPQILKASQITFGSLYPQTAQNINNTSGTIYMGAFFNDPLGSFAGNGTFATITLAGLTPGTSPFTFRCTPGATNDTNITQKDPAQDVIDCSLLTDGSYTVPAPNTSPTPTLPPGVTPTLTLTPTASPTPGGTGSSPTSTPTPTPTWTSPVEDGANTPTPTLTQLPETAHLTPTLTLAMLGAILLIGSGLLLAL
jgi:hypothetical protein